MSTIAEIVAAIERLPDSQVEALAVWLDRFRSGKALPSSAEQWLSRARGAAQSEMTTDAVMALTRGEG